MKVLYAIQGTGNGHISRARDIVPVLQKYCQLDLLISGNQSNVTLNYDFKYKYKGLSFVLGKNGGIDFWNTYLQTNLKRLVKEIKDTNVAAYDLVINDFEPVSAWACYKNKIPCISLSHQAAVIHPNAPQPAKKDFFGSFILKNYAPTNIQFGFHFDEYAENIYTPVIRQEIRKAKTTNKEHYTVYLPSYSDERLLELLPKVNVKWHIFSKEVKTSREIKNIKFIPINNQHFIESLSTGKGLLCNAGFEGPAEAIYLKKKLLVIPQKSQFEQSCNATAVAKLGVPTIQKLNEKSMSVIQEWIESQKKVEIEYPDITTQIIEKIFSNNTLQAIKENQWKAFQLF